MPHLIIDRLRELPSIFNNFSLPGPKSSQGTVIVLEILDLIAGVTFLFGSIYFLPCYAKDEHAFIIGCRLYLYGSYIFIFVCGLCLVETLMEKRMSFELWENSLYFVGSLAFVVGTFLYMPEKDDYAPLVRFWKKHRTMQRTASIEKLIDALPDDQVSSDDSARVVMQKAQDLERMGIGQYVNYNQKQFVGTVLFMAGSVLFAFAAFTNALSQKNFNRWTSKMLTTTTTMYMTGSLQFVMGSMCFLPQIVDSEEVAAIGAWLFIGGSLCFIVGSLLSLWRTIVIYRGDAEESDALNSIS